MTAPEPHSVILLSGGIDSATVLAMEAARGLGNTIHCLSARYGQRHEYEVIAAKRFAKQYESRIIDHRVVTLPIKELGRSPLTGDGEVPCRTLEELRNTPSPAYVPARNTLFMAMALALAEGTGSQRILMGMNRDDWVGFPDCRPEFIIAWNGLGRVVTQSEISIEAPILTWPKSQVIQAAVGLYGIRLQDTLSCYQPPRKRYDRGFVHCGRCDACILRRDAAAKASENLTGWTDPTIYAADL